MVKIALNRFTKQRPARFLLFLGAISLPIVFTVYFCYEQFREKSVLELFEDPPGPFFWEDISRPKVVLFATTRFGIPWSRASPFDNCPVSNCEITYNINHFHRSDLVVFLGVGVDILPVFPKFQILHKIRPKKQIWLFLMQESPVNTLYNVSILDGFFNWTETYRKDSDIFFPYYHYRYRVNPQFLTINKTMLKAKNKTVAWMASNLNANYRLDIVRKLQQFGVQVDVFGKASGNVSERACGWDCPEFFKSYKFYLAFENSFCKDYITEKYWLSLIHGMVPIVLGGADYTDRKLAIPRSYINALDFYSVKELAEYILYLDKNISAYAEFFSWKAKYEVGGIVDLSLFCSMCAKINTEVNSSKTYKNLTEFWGVHTCQKIETIPFLNY